MLAHVPGVEPRHCLLLWAVPSRAQLPPGRAMIGPSQKYRPRDGSTGSGCMDNCSFGMFASLYIGSLYKHRPHEAIALADKRCSEKIQTEKKLKKLKGAACEEPYLVGLDYKLINFKDHSEVCAIKEIGMRLTKLKYMCV